MCVCVLVLYCTALGFVVFVALPRGMLRYFMRRRAAELSELLYTTAYVVHHGDSLVKKKTFWKIILKRIIADAVVQDDARNATGRNRGERHWWWIPEILFFIFFIDITTCICVHTVQYTDNDATKIRISRIEVIFLFFIRLAADLFDWAKILPLIVTFSTVVGDVYGGFAYTHTHTCTTVRDNILL